MYLVFGEDRSNYQQALFSILSVLPQLNEDEEIVVVTDSLEKFKLLDQRIRILKIDKATLETWKGSYENFFRIKIMALLHVAKIIPNTSVLYFDADTFLFGNLANIRIELENGRNIMHTNEGKLSSSTSKSQKPLWKRFKGKTFENISINAELCMWNAGVVGVSKNHIEALDTALNLCDTFCKTEVKPRLIEQLSVSIALTHHGGIASADHEIGHYWGNKSMWNQKIEGVFLDSFLHQTSIEDLMMIIKALDFEEIPILIKSKDTKIRLQELMTKVFKDKKVEFIKSSKKDFK